MRPLKVFDSRRANLETPMCFSVVTCFLLGGYNLLPKKELHRSLQVCSPITIIPDIGCNSPILEKVEPR